MKVKQLPLAQTRNSEVAWMKPMPSAPTV